MITITRLYDNYDNAHAAVEALEAAGVPSDDISIVAHTVDGKVIQGQGTLADEGAGTGAGLGAVVGGAGGMLAGLGMIAIPGIGPVVAAGWIAATLAGTLAGAAVGGVAGGLVGSMVESGVPEEDANVYAEAVRRGGAVVAARVSEEKASQAEAILDRTSSVDINKRRSEYATSGWKEFDETGKPLTDDEIDRERNRYRNEHPLL